MNKLGIALLLSTLAVATTTMGCVPEHDYSGQHEMTWAAVLVYPAPVHSVARGGTTLVSIRPGPGDELLLDLGPGLCRLSGSYVAADRPDDWPYFAMAPQRCFVAGEHGLGGTELLVGGTGTYERDEERLTMVLTGSFEADGKRGSVTWQFSSTW